jgi:hypothetical protein
MIPAPEAKPKPVKMSPEYDPRAAFKNFRAGDDEYLGSLLVSQLAICVPVPNGADIASAFMKGLRPRNLLQTLLYSQMAVTHMTAMLELQQAQKPESQESTDLHLSRANRLLRTFCLQIEAVESLRGKGRQKITVQHRHVSVTANQAVVGVGMKGGS